MTNDKKSYSENTQSDDEIMRKRLHKKKKARQRKLTRLISTVILVVAIAVFCFAAYKLISIIVSYNRAEETYSQIDDMFIETVPETEKETEPTTARESSAQEESQQEPDTESTQETETTEAEPELEYVMETVWVWDYDKLTAINSDAIGYIRSEGSGGSILSYPIVQGTDNDYYLDHMFTGEANSSGAVFMDCNASERFDSTYCIIYGHNMRSGSGMFHCLENYKEEWYYWEHEYIDIYDGYTQYVYRVFAAFQTTVDSFVYNNSAYDYDGALELFKKGVEASSISGGMSEEEFPEDPHIITLSTCTANYSETDRYVVMLIRVQ